MRLELVLCVLRPSSLSVIASAAMVRPRKKHTVHDLRKLKGQRCLTHIHVKSPEEAAAADAAGIDLMSCSFDSPEAQARLPQLVAAAPGAFFSGSTPHGMASPEEAIRTGFRALELGASSVYCSGSAFLIEAMAREGIPVVGHIGMVPRHVTWTGYRSIGKTVEDAQALYRKMKDLENAGAYAAEIEIGEEHLERDRRGDLATADQRLRHLVDAPMDLLGEMHRLEEVRHPVIGVVVD
jgi:3-methyl-2-oxobutanoate hydroxymethyltransferase